MPSLKMTGRRSAISSTDARQMASITRSTIMIVVIGMPKSLFMKVELRSQVDKAISRRLPWPTTSVATFRHGPKK